MLNSASDEHRLVELISALSRSSDRAAQRALDEASSLEQSSEDPLGTVAEALVNLRHQQDQDGDDSEANSADDDGNLESE